MSSCSLKQLTKVGHSRKKALAKTEATAIADAPSVLHGANLPLPDTFSSVHAADTAGVMRHLIDMVTPVWNVRLSYHTMNGKAKVHFEGPNESQDFTASIRVKKDSAIWVDITALGGMIHAARALITNDSFFMINYLQKEYSKGALVDVAKILPTNVDFYSLQNLVMAEPLRSGAIMDVAELGASWLVHVADSSYLQTLNCTKADSTISIDQVNTRNPNGPQAIMKYERFEYTCGKRIAMTRTINIQNLQDKFLVEMDFQNIEFDKGLEMPFNIPSKFSLN
jgi:hypothetical protein